MKHTENTKWLNLQLFAGEGEAGGGEGAASGENAVDAEQQKLLDLGVPPEKLRRRAKSAPAMVRAEATSKDEGHSNSASERESAGTQDAAVEPKTEETKDAPIEKNAWDTFMADPENNKRMQSIVQSRLKSAKAAEENLMRITPALELLARKHGLDPANIDYEALAAKISDDGSFYEEKALQMGVSVETAKEIDKNERDTARQRAHEARTLEQQKFASHIEKLKTEGEALKKVFPTFDLMKELQNPRFASMTSPSGGVSVEDAYYAIHRKEIQTAAMQKTKEETARKLSNAIQSGMGRPDESGAAARSPSVSTFNYAKADRSQREAFKKDLRAAWARGEKVYPRQMK